MTAGAPDLVRVLDHPEARRPGTALAAEALGYLGGVLAVAGVARLGSMVWPDLSDAARVTLLGLAASAFVAVGCVALRDAGGPARRLRTVLWLVAVALTGACLGLLGESILDLQDGWPAVLATSGAAVVAALLWHRHPTLAQQAAMMVATMATVASTTAALTEIDMLPGLGAWLVALAWCGLGWRNVLGPAWPVRVLSSAALVLTSLTTLPADAGFVLAIATVLGVLVLALALEDLALLAVAAVGTLMVLPPMLGEWFPGSAGAPVVLVVVGILLAGLGVRIARSSTRRRSPGQR